MGREIVISRGRGGVVATRAGLLVPGIVADAGDAAARRVLEFFGATISGTRIRGQLIIAQWNWFSPGATGAASLSWPG